MRSRIPLRRSLSLSLLLSVADLTQSVAQSADDYFHGGAQQFITNNIQGALLTVTNGLQLFPDDIKLQKLWELLNQQQQQQQDKQQQEQQQKDQQKDQQDQQSKQDQQKQEEDQQQAQAQKSPDQQKQEQKDQSNQSGQAEEKKQAEAQAMQAHAMTPQEAKQLLDAQKDKEQVLIFKPQGEPQKPKTKTVKDW